MLSQSGPESVDRHPSDVIRLILGTLVLVVSAWAVRGGLGSLESDVSQVVDNIPSSTRSIVTIISYAGSLAAVGLITIAALVSRRYRSAAGIVAIAAFGVASAAGPSANVLTCVMAACTIGAVLGFLVHNFHPAKVFMGDSGSLLLGFILAALSVVSADKGAATVAVWVPVAALALPIADTILAIVRRLGNGKPVMAGDKEHIHHNLLALGLRHRTATLVLYVVGAMCALVSVVLARFHGTVAACSAVLLVLILYVAFRGIGFLHQNGRLKQPK